MRITDPRVHVLGARPVLRDRPRGRTQSSRDPCGGGQHHVSHFPERETEASLAGSPGHVTKGFQCSGHAFDTPLQRTQKLMSGGNPPNEACWPDC